MHLFQVKEGTEVLVHDDNAKDWPHYTCRQSTLKRDLLFDLEDIRIDPLGRVGSGPDSVTIGGEYAKLGYYGFQFKHFCVLVSADKVEVL